MTSSEPHLNGQRSRMRPAAIVAATLLTCGLVAGCAGIPMAVPQAVLQVPGSYTFSRSAEYEVPGGTVIVCYSGGSSLVISRSYASYGSLSWTPFDGSTQTAASWTDADSYVDTFPLQPGCGTLRVSLYHDGGDRFPSTITVTVTEIGQT